MDIKKIFQSEFQIPSRYVYLNWTEIDEYIEEWHENVENYTKEQIDMFADGASFEQKTVNEVYPMDKFLKEYYSNTNMLEGTTLMDQLKTKI
jgi:hypothetical protein